jgi:CRP/FNR family transcriptional regulator, anaerobic regulatory protein
MLPALLAALARFGPVHATDETACRHYFKPLALRKNTVLEAAGQVPRHLYFINTGYLRLYYPLENGNEATTCIGSPGNFLTPFLSFVHERPALESLATVSASEVLRITRPELHSLIDTSAAFRAFSILIFEQAISVAEQRAYGLATRTATERYAHLLATRPEVLRHVPVHHIASYLGITPESLSRIRRQFTLP